MAGASARIERWLGSAPAWWSLGLVALIGFFDYVSGFELNFASIYLFPVALATWRVSLPFGIFVSVLSVVVSVGGDFVAGQRFTSAFTLAWNTGLALGFYSAVAWVLRRLRLLQDQLEDRVRQRAAALNAEITERARLEEELLRISEREQVRIGHDLHDSLCQDLTGVALAAEVLGEQLESQPDKAAAARHIAGMTGDAIELTRKLARGLYPVELKDEGFMDALHELAGSVSERLKISCVLVCAAEVPARNANAAMQLYRIAQEAINNAVKHGQARRVSIRLETAGAFTQLTVSDNGTGIPHPAPTGSGLGLRIMAYRARLVGAECKVERLAPTGTRVTCRIPNDVLMTAAPRSSESPDTDA